jgi:hypothetical protein
MEIEQVTAAGGAVLKVGVNPLSLVGLVRIRSRTGRSISVIFNLSIAQVLRLFIHRPNISLYERNSGRSSFGRPMRNGKNAVRNGIPDSEPLVALRNN